MDVHSLQIRTDDTAAFDKGIKERLGRKYLETVTYYLRKSVQIVAAAAAMGVMFAGPVQVYGSAAQNEYKDAALENTAGEISGTEGLSFEKAIESFYRNSGSLSDEEVLASARDILSDGDVLYSDLKADECEVVLEALTAYEESKAEYLTSSMNGSGQKDGTPAGDADTKRTSDGSSVSSASAQDPLCREWDRQEKYAQMMVSEGAVIREMIPRFQVVSCTKKDNVLEVDLDEWMTQGYSVSADADIVNASAYSYSFTLTLECSDDGVWTPSEINGTDINFAWLVEGEDPVTESGEAPAVLFEVKSDMDDAPVAYAQIGGETAVSGTESAEDGAQQNQESLSFEIDENSAVSSEAVRHAADTQYAQAAELYETAAANYTYKPAAAAAYADKYWKKYNRSYKEYRGVDCANFVSQCLYAGGMPKTSDWYPQSVNWINVMGHIRHFKEYGAFVTAGNGNVLVGNPVYYDWNGNGTYDHTGICVGKNASGMPVVDAHTNNVYHVPWSMGSRGKRATIILRSSVKASSSGNSASKNVWRTIGGKVYYIGSDGKYVKNKFLDINGARYYFDSKGVRASAFFKVGKKWYYASVKNGKLLKGWQVIGHKTYYFSVKDYSRMTPGKHKIGSGTYYFNSKGVRQTSFIKIGSKWYYADKKTGKFVKGWKKINGKWYYFDKKTMVKAVGWKTINGKKCYFNSKGVLTKGKHG